MFCPGCGSEINNSPFCPKCGRKLNGKDNNKSATVKKKSPLVWVAVCAILILCVGVCAFIFLHKKTIDMNQYVKVEFTGYDTLGKANASINWHAFNRDYGDKIKCKNGNVNSSKKDNSNDSLSALLSGDLDSLLDDSQEDEALVNGISGKLDKTDKLSNGDIIVFKWKCDDDINDNYNYNFSFSDIEYTVKNLDTIEMFNPFDVITVSFEGNSPNGYANINVNYNENEEAYYLDYQIDNNSGLKNGDKVTIKVVFNESEKHFIENFGKYPEPMEKEYLVEGLPEGIASGEMLNDELLSKMQMQSEDIIKAMAANSWGSEVKLKSMDYLGYYLLQSKGNASDENRCILVYKIKPEVTMDTGVNGIVIKEYDDYFYVQFENLFLDKNGSNNVDISHYSIPEDYFYIDTGYTNADGYWNYEYWFTGYDSLDNLYKNVVVRNLEKYTHEDNVVE